MALNRSPSVDPSKHSTLYKVWFDSGMSAAILGTPRESIPFQGAPWPYEAYAWVDGYDSHQHEQSLK